ARKPLPGALEKAEVPTEQIPSVLASADLWSQRLRSDTHRHDALLRLIDRVELGRSSFRVSVNLDALLEGPDRQIILARESALTIKRRGVEMRLVLGSGASREASVDRVLLKEIARARRCFEALLSGGAASVEAAAALEGIDKSYVSRLLPLAFLSPDIVQAIVCGSSRRI